MGGSTRHGGQHAFGRTADDAPQPRPGVVRLVRAGEPQSRREAAATAAAGVVGESGGGSELAHVAVHADGARSDTLGGSGALLVFARRQLASGLRTWSDAAAAKKLRLRSMVLNGLQRIAVAWRSWLSLLGSQAETLVLMGHALATWTNQQLAIGLRTWVAAATETMQRQRALIAAWIKRLLTAGWRSWRLIMQEREAGRSRARIFHDLHNLGVGRRLALAWFKFV